MPCRTAGWYVLPRPEGKRVLVMVQGCCTLARGMNGAITHKWQSYLPGGSAGYTTSSKSIVKDGACTVLDCIFHELDSTFYVLDMLCWNGYR